MQSYRNKIFSYFQKYRTLIIPGGGDPPPPHLLQDFLQFSVIQSEYVVHLPLFFHLSQLLSPRLFWQLVAGTKH